jgi:hypothetical protein
LWSVVDVDEHSGLTEHLRHPRLREVHVAVADLGLRSSEQDAGRQAVGVGNLGRRARTGNRIDRPPLPGDAAEDRLGAVVDPCMLGGCQRPDDVTAAAHAEHERPPRPAEQLLGIGHALISIGR